VKVSAFGGVDSKREMRHRADLEVAKWRATMSPDVETPTADQVLAEASTTEQPAIGIESAAEPAAPIPAETNESAPA
jgi:hypothetical protein